VLCAGGFFLCCVQQVSICAVRSRYLSLLQYLHLARIFKIPMVWLQCLQAGVPSAGLFTDRLMAGLGQPQMNPQAQNLRESS